MKNHVLKRLLTTGVILGMLLPWVMAVPASAEGTGGTDAGTSLYFRSGDSTYLRNKSAVINYWGPNTEDTDVTSSAQNASRRDFDFISAVFHGPQENGTYRMVQFYTKDAKDAEDNFDYGLRRDADGTPGTLSLTVKKGSDGSALALNTNEYGEMELTFQYVRGKEFNYPSIELIDNDFQVRVSTDGGVTWKDGYAGMKSHRLIAECNLGQTGTGTAMDCFEVKSEDLTALAEGETINAIQVRPFGDFDDYTAQYAFVKSIGVTGYETAAPDASAEYVHVDGDILRQIVTAHAKRLNSDTWVSSEDVQSNVQWADDGEVQRAITYYKNVRYGGPIYSGKNASTYERFLSDIDENGNYTGALLDNAYGDEGINGMDCGTVVYDCLSQVTASKSLSSWYYLFYDLYDAEDNPNGKAVPLYQAAQRGGIDRNSHNEYFDQLVSASGGEEAMYALYDALRPGDFIYDEGHTRVITSPTQNGTVYVGETAGGTIEHYYERLSDGAVISTTSTAYKTNPSSYESVYASENPGETIEYLYSSSMRYDRPLAAGSIYSGKYLPYTLREYTTGQVEKENVLITTNDPASFVTDGFSAVIDSNYTIRAYTITLTDKNDPAGEPVYQVTKYGVHSDFSVLVDDDGLNAVLASTPGQYELKVEVLSGPRIYLANGNVINDVDDAADTVNPTTTFVYDILVEAEDDVAAAVGTQAPAKAHQSICDAAHEGAKGVATVSNGVITMSSSGLYYLDSDINVSALQIKANAANTLCLNGHNITVTAQTYAYFMHAINARRVNICNCQETGGQITVVAASGSDVDLFQMRATAQLYLYDNVTFTGCSVTDFVQYNSATAPTVNLCGVKFENNTFSGTFNLGTGTMNMYAGTQLKGVTVNVGAGTTFNMMGGLIKNTNGPGVTVAAGGTFNKESGTIYSNTGA